MDELLLLKALVMGVVEGVTEFLPISSTGHLILAGDLLGLHMPTAEVFEVVIQSGAMLAVLWEYREKFWSLFRGLFGDSRSWRFIVNLGIAFTPAAVLGLAFGSYITSRLFQPIPVALAFVAGGCIILWAERRPHTVAVHEVDDVTWRHALKIGCAQCVALIPGMSRAGATIIGGLLFGLSRKAATEFSFFLAVPTLLAAGAYQAYKARALFSADDIGFFAVGSLAAFVSAYFAVRWLLRYVSTHDFTAFAWYRLVFGAIVIVTAYTGLVQWTVR